jgi:PAS domain S-box-containing protein
MYRFLFITLLLALFASAIAAPSPATTKVTKRVLILYSMDKEHPAHGLTEQGISEVLRANQEFDVKLYSEYLDMGRFIGPAQSAAMADYLRRKYTDLKIDVIITIYPAAVDFLLGARSTLFPDVPIVAGEIIRSYAENLDRSPERRHITGTVMGENITGVLDAVLRLKPGTKRVALVTGVSPLDIYNEQIVRAGLKSYAGRLELIDLTKLPVPEILSRVAVLPQDSVIVYMSVIKDGAGQIFTPREVLYLINRATKVPVFSLYDTYLGHGIVGGRLVSFELQGKAAAGLALRVMAGEPPLAIPFGGDGAYVDHYDWRELKRWNIPKAAVPAGTKISYYTPTYWEEHRWAIIGAVSLLIIETTLIIVLMINIRKRRQAERSQRDSEEQVRLAVTAAGAGLLSLDREGSVVWATDRARELYGFIRDEPVPLDNLLQVVHPEDQMLVHQATQRAWETGDDINIEYRLILPDGTVRWVAMRGGVPSREPEVDPLFMGAIIDITARKQTDATLRHHEQELAALAGRLINNQEEELRRLSRELHDDLTQKLAVLAIDAGMLEKTVLPLHAETAAELQKLKSRLIEVSNEVHRISRQLHPAVLDDLGLIQAAQTECDAFRKRTGIDLTFEARDVTAKLPPDVALCLYRVLQEALQNMAKHSRASEAHVLFEERPDALHLLIQDFGIGFDRHQATGGGIGLSSIRERVRLANGTLTIESEPGEGTGIHVIIPKEEAAHG